MIIFQTLHGLIWNQVKIDGFDVALGILEMETPSETQEVKVKKPQNKWTRSLQPGTLKGLFLHVYRNNELVS